MLAGRKFVDYAMSLIRMNDNFILIASWFFITILYLIFINFLTKKRANLIYVRKHYHFLLFLNTNLAFWAGKVKIHKFKSMHLAAQERCIVYAALYLLTYCILVCMLIYYFFHFRLSCSQSCCHLYCRFLS